jgi:hypothetical protein
VGFCSSDTYRMKGQTFSISVGLVTSGKSFTAGFGIGWKRLTPTPFDRDSVAAKFGQMVALMVFRGSSEPVRRVVP